MDIPPSELLPLGDWLKLEQAIDCAWIVIAKCVRGDGLDALAAAKGEFERQLSDAAFNGRLRFRGVRPGSTQVQDIPPEYFRMPRSFDGHNGEIAPLASDARVEDVLNKRAERPVTAFCLVDVERNGYAEWLDECYGRRLRAAVDDDAEKRRQDIAERSVALLEEPFWNVWNVLSCIAYRDRDMLCRIENHSGLIAQRRYESASMKDQRPELSLMNALRRGGLTAFDDHGDDIKAERWASVARVWDLPCRFRRDQVLALWSITENAAGSATIAAERNCKLSLIELMKATPHSPIAKADVKRTRFPTLPQRMFERAWSAAIVESGAGEWALPGRRPSKSPHRNRLAKTNRDGN
jgi:hypothetical protein